MATHPLCMSSAAELKALSAELRNALDALRAAGKEADAAKVRHALHAEAPWVGRPSLKVGGRRAPQRKDFVAAAKQRAVPILVEMRRRWRRMNAEVRDLQDKLTAESVRLDAHDLQLQNLRYQQNHLERETRACREAPCVASCSHLPAALTRLPLSRLPHFESLEMESEQSFRDSVTASGGTVPEDEHARMLTRLAHEKELREGLQARRAELQRRLEEYRSSARAKQKALDAIPALVESIEKVRPSRAPARTPARSSEAAHPAPARKRPGEPAAAEAARNAGHAPAGPPRRRGSASAAAVPAVRAV